MQTDQHLNILIFSLRNKKSIGIYRLKKDIYLEELRQDNVKNLISTETISEIVNNKDIILQVGTGLVSYVQI